MVEKFHGVLRYFVEKTDFYSERVEIDLKLASRLLFCVDENELLAIISQLCTYKYIANLTSTLENKLVYQITLEGLKYYQDIIMPSLKTRQCFVAMWFNSKANKKNFSPNMQEVYATTIKTAVEKDGRFSSIKIDCVDHCNDINDEMIAQIRKSRFMVADLTGYRAGVYWEAGFAYGLGIPVIYTCHEKRLKGDKN